ncbi:MAG: aminotransferase class V-fold PLP-dependent enzyme [Sphingomonadaceae bacterium]|nr:aminotransferase class V-fold PLP-dependent enzyme [Sphingomonadaceae bacterium]
MERLYLDHAATTPMTKAAREAMAQALDHWANPSSPHAEGRRARAALESARAQVATALDWKHSLIFTSGASEAIGIVLARAQARRQLIAAVEHDAVRRQARDALDVPVDESGRIDMVALDRLIEEAGPRPLVAVQAANSETGVLQPLDAVIALVRSAGGLLLADCAQTAGKLPLPDADFVIVSGHKLGAGPGIGALLVRDLGTLAPSGGQELGYRRGTEHMPGALALAAALEGGAAWMARAEELRRYVDAQIEAAGGEVIARGAARLATIASYRMPGVSAATQLIRFDLAGIAISAGSACASGTLRPSHVLQAMGMAEAPAGEVIRMSFGRGTSRADLWRFVEAWKEISDAARGDAGAQAAA